MTAAHGRVSRIAIAIALLALPSVLGGALAIWLSRAHVATRVEATVVAGRVSIVVGGSGPVNVLDRTPFRSVQVTRFSRVLLPGPISLERIDPALAVSDPARAPSTAWARLTFGPTIEITAPRKDLHPTVTIEPAQPTTRGRIVLAGAKPGSALVMEAGGEGKAPYLALFLRGDGALADIDVGPLAYVTVTSGRIAGTQISDAAPSETLRVAQSPSSPLIRAEGDVDGLRLSLQLEAASPSSDIPVASLPIPVTRIDFERQGPLGKPVSTLMADAEVRYLDYPSLAPRTIPSRYFLTIDPEAAELTTVALLREGGQAAIKLRLSGRVRGLRGGTESDATPIDLRLTRFDVLRHDQTLAALLGVAGWLLGTTLAARRLWQELSA